MSTPFTDSSARISCNEGMLPVSASDRRRTSVRSSAFTVGCICFCAQVCSKSAFTFLRRLPNVLQLRLSANPPHSKPFPPAAAAVPPRPRPHQPQFRPRITALRSRSSQLEEGRGGVHDDALRLKPVFNTRFQHRFPRKLCNEMLELTGRSDRVSSRHEHYCHCHQ
jgi:hypothetical protein